MNTSESSRLVSFDDIFAEVASLRKEKQVENLESFRDRAKVRQIIEQAYFLQYVSLCRKLIDNPLLQEFLAEVLPDGITSRCPDKMVLPVVGTALFDRKYMRGSLYKRDELLKVAVEFNQLLENLREDIEKTIYIRDYLANDIGHKSFLSFGERVKEIYNNHYLYHREPVTSLYSYFVFVYIPESLWLWLHAKDRILPEYINQMTMAISTIKRRFAYTYWNPEHPRGQRHIEKMYQECVE